MEIIKTTALITINETLWVQMIVFLLFLFVINRIMFRPVRRNMAEREGHFENLRQAIVALEQEMTALSKRTQAEEDQLKTAARRMAEDLREEGHQEARRLVGEAMGEIRTLRQETETRLQATMNEVRPHVETASNALARAIVAHVKTP